MEPVFKDPYVKLFESPGREAFATLIDEEPYFVAPESYVNNEPKKALRRTAVGLVESLCTSSLDALIPYTAMTYFDRYLSRNGARIPNVAKGKEKLFVVCCVTLAWKLRNKNFLLSAFLCENGLVDQYQRRNVLEMELHICRGLEWRMRTLTPFCFVEFYIPYLRCPDFPPPRRLVRDLIIRSQCDIAFTDIRPSVLAVCAVIVVSKKVLPLQHDFFELKITTDVEPLRLQRNMVLKCLQLLRPFFRNPPICKLMDVWTTIPDKSEESGTCTSRAQPAADEEIAVVDDKVNDVDVLMNFDPGWDEWLTECETRDGKPPRFSRQNLIKCWIKIGSGCENFRDTVEWTCNIL